MTLLDKVAVACMSSIVALTLLAPATAAAGPCCRTLTYTCNNFTVAACLAEGGIPGYCQLAAACSQPQCNASAILPIRDLTAVKWQATVWLAWSADAQADRSNAWYVTDKRDLPAACAGCRPASAVPDGTPTTIARVPHANAVDGPAGAVLFYDVSAACGSGGGTGACCSLAGSCSIEAGPACTGVYGGDGSVCGTCMGACCLSATSCQQLTSTSCAQSGGFFQGPGSTCAAGTCNVLGACCQASGPCAPSTAGSCAVSGGTYLGDGTSCTSCTGACCTGTSCLDAQTYSACVAALGSYQGSGVSCGSTDCGVVGACCNQAGSCRQLTRAACSALGRTYLGDGVACGTQTCPVPPVTEACCLGIACVEGLTRAGCDARGGTALGPASTCPVRGCGACCSPPAGDCRYTDASNCAGTYRGDGTPCSPSPCTAACCFRGACTDDRTRAECDATGGVYQGYPSECRDVTCPATGACCVLGTCLQRTSAECAAEGGAFRDGPCLASTCAAGACCLVQGCVMHTSWDCAAAGGSFGGGPCQPDTCTPGACCYGCSCWVHTRPYCEATGGVFLFPGGDCSFPACDICERETPDDAL